VIFDDTRYDESFGFSHLLFPASDPTAPWLAHPKAILESFLNRHRLMPTKLIRVKANLLARASNPKPFSPHVDMPGPHWVMIYYVNDSDGDTLILDKTYPDRENTSIVHAVNPKRGRAILFDGRHYHCGTCPTRHDTTPGWSLTTTSSDHFWRRLHTRSLHRIFMNRTSHYCPRYISFVL
jgi:hypothetical protein